MVDPYAYRPVGLPGLSPLSAQLLHAAHFACADGDRLRVAIEIYNERGQRAGTQSVTVTSAAGDLLAVLQHCVVPTGYRDALSMRSVQVAQIRGVADADCEVLLDQLAKQHPPDWPIRLATGPNGRGSYRPDRTLPSFVLDAYLQAVTRAHPGLRVLPSRTTEMFYTQPSSGVALMETWAHELCKGVHSGVVPVYVSPVAVHDRTVGLFVVRGHAGQGFFVSLHGSPMHRADWAGAT